ncbi:winged helix-turn-helix transcriptional regulator [Acrocarpospora catenulata]|uniref:winged helix-turn-helix transcriptional regulator n=1 Tax=Acrocarpospora catenulata TaxID=2836182 RepID=UPI001BDA0707|nr:helix-turn-helix domain-containing protein [Acrocarpospora catenulata]
MDTATRRREAVAVPAGPCSRWPAESLPIIRDVLERVGDKWSMLVIGTLRDGPLRYTDLQHAVPGISQRMLTLTLRQLRRDGLLTRTAYAEVPPRVEYALTPLGTTLLDLTLSLIDWAGAHHQEIRDNRADFDAQ